MYLSLQLSFRHIKRKQAIPLLAKSSDAACIVFTRAVSRKQNPHYIVMSYNPIKVKFNVKTL